MKPFFFGSSAKPLFGVYHPPAAGAPRREGVVLCCPFGREYLRAHRALRELAHRLAASGFHALRFDYSGSGDSSGEGEDADMEGWLSDISAAIEEIRNVAGTDRVSLLGLRLGGALALLAARREQPVERLALWDPVIVGSSYLSELLELQHAWSLAHPGLPGLELTARGPLEILGFPLSGRLRDGIEQIDLLRAGPVAAERALFLFGVPTPEAEQFRDRLPSVARAATVQHVPGAKFWLKGEGIDQALVPSAAVQSIADWFCESSP